MTHSLTGACHCGALRLTFRTQTRPETLPLRACGCSFCRNCGIRVYTHGHVKEAGGDYVSVVLSTLDDLAPSELAAAPVRYMNGRDDDWMHAPAETRHL